MSDDAKAACRAALLRACWGMNLSIPNEYGDGKKRQVVDVDDAAACMARALHEAALTTNTGMDERIRAALAATAAWEAP